MNEDRLSALTLAAIGIAALGIAVLLGAPPARAADGDAMPKAGPAAPRGVVELFTSQGCSSCPPADAALGRIIAEGDVLALSYHVDYWNYLGWQDTFSSKANTARQYGYAASLGRENVYTPQAVINGRDHVVGSDEAAIERKITAFAGTGRGLSVPVQAALSGDTLSVTIGKGSGSGNVVLVRFDGRNVVDVKRGENGGHTLASFHTVRDIQTVGMWSGGEMTLKLPAMLVRGEGDRAAAPGGGVAVLLQEAVNGKDPGPILGATVVSADPQS